MPGSIPKNCYIDINTISKQIDDCVITFFSRFGIDIYDIGQCKAIPHNTLTLCFKYIYESLFKPSQTLCNNQKSLIDYNNNDLLSVIVDSFIKWALWFDKSMGLMQFSLMTGIHRETLAEWRDKTESNPIRSDLIKSICEVHKMEQINILNGSPVGALAVANNDVETGLEWSKQQALLQASNTVFLLPSERLDKLKLSKAEP